MFMLCCSKKRGDDKSSISLGLSSRFLVFTPRDGLWGPPKKPLENLDSLPWYGGRISGAEALQLLNSALFLRLDPSRAAGQVGVMSFRYRPRVFQDMWSMAEK